MTNEDVIKSLLEDTRKGILNVDDVLRAALHKLDTLGENHVYNMAIEEKFITADTFDYDDEKDVIEEIEKEIDKDTELTAQQKIIEKVLARYGDYS